MGNCCAKAKRIIHQNFTEERSPSGRKHKMAQEIRNQTRYTGGSMSIPVTKFSLRMYGSEKAVEQEQKRQETEGSFVIHPYSNFRFYWDFITLILLIISMLIIPVAITFFNEKMTSDTGWIAFNLCLDFWFLSDIIMNFHTGVILEYGDGDVILDLRSIRLRYLKSWFAVDLISTLPVDYFLQLTHADSASASASRAMKLFRFAKIISLLRLLRISRLIRYVHQWEQIVGMQYDLAVAAVRIFNLVCLMLLIGHWNGCLQFLVPLLNDFPADCWIIIDNLKDAPWPEQYSWCLFKAMSHMLCIGYGQQPPQNVMDLWMTMLSMVSGAVCFAMFIGHATALIQSMDSSKRQYKEKYMQVKEYMRFRRLPKSLRSRVYGYYENRFQGKMFDEQGILDELSNNLREEVVNYNCRHLVASVPFFSNAEPDFVTEVVQKLKYEVFQPEDVIVREGAVGKKMYFIQHGLVEVRNSQLDKPIKRLTDGSFFGEICLLINDRRVASVIAVSYCSTYSLHVDDFNYILSEHPVMRKILERVAAARLSSIGKSNTELDERVKESTNLFTKTNDMVEEIVRHDGTKMNEMKCQSQILHYRKQTTVRPLTQKYTMQTSKSCSETISNILINSPLSIKVNRRSQSDLSDKFINAMHKTPRHSLNQPLSDPHHLSSSKSLHSIVKANNRASTPSLRHRKKPKLFSSVWTPRLRVRHSDKIKHNEQKKKDVPDSPLHQCAMSSESSNAGTSLITSTTRVHSCSDAESDGVPTVPKSSYTKETIVEVEKFSSPDVDSRCQGNKIDLLIQEPIVTPQSEIEKSLWTNNKDELGNNPNNTICCIIDEKNPKPDRKEKG